MAPEQIRGDALDGRADQFAWGVLAYELLTGRLPWRGAGDTLAVVASILTDDVPREPLARAGVPPEVEAVVLRALAKKPDARFASMDDVVRALDAAAQGEASGDRAAPRRPPRPPRALRPPPGRRARDEPSLGRASASRPTTCARSSRAPSSSRRRSAPSAAASTTCSPRPRGRRRPRGAARGEPRSAREAGGAAGLDGEKRDAWIRSRKRGLLPARRRLGHRQRRLRLRPRPAAAATRT